MSLVNQDVVVQYDSATEILQTLPRRISQLGFPASFAVARYSDAVVAVAGMTTDAARDRVECTLWRLAGVRVAVMGRSQVRVLFDPAAADVSDVCRAIAELGYGAPRVVREREVGRVRVAGMVCESCVRHVRGGIADVAGVWDVHVSLEEELVTVSYDPRETSVQRMCEAIEDMGFEATVAELPSAKQRRVSRAPPVLGAKSTADSRPLTATATLRIDNMTHQSCARHIENTIADQDGVCGVIASVEEASATIRYNVGQTGPDRLRVAVETIGFRAAVVTPETGGATKRKASAKNVANKNEHCRTCVIGVQGMTCNSCVESVRSKVESMAGVTSASVSLADGTASVKYDRAKIVPQTIANGIDDLGFRTSLVIDSNSEDLPTEVTSFNRNGSVRMFIKSKRAITVDKGLKCEYRPCLNIV